MNNKNLTIIIVLFAILIGGTILFSQKTDDSRVGIIDNVYVSDNITHTTVDVQTYEPTLVLATSTNRIDATFCKADISSVDATAYLSFTNTDENISIYEGYQLQNGECARLEDILGYHYVGAIYGLSTSTTSTLSVTSK